MFLLFLFFYFLPSTVTINSLCNSKQKTKQTKAVFWKRGDLFNYKYPFGGLPLFKIFQSFLFSTPQIEFLKHVGNWSHHSEVARFILHKYSCDSDLSPTFSSASMPK